MSKENKQTISKQLAKCPFCGGEAQIHESNLGTYRVICRECPCSVGRHWYWSVEEAIKAWNTRKPMQNIVERLEEEKEEKLREYKEFLDGEDYRQSLLLDKAIEIVKEEGGIL